MSFFPWCVVHQVESAFTFDWGGQQHSRLHQRSQGQRSCNSFPADLGVIYLPDRLPREIPLGPPFQHIGFLLIHQFDLDKVRSARLT
jgi:hypothetical protein